MVDGFKKVLLGGSLRVGVLGSLDGFRSSVSAVSAVTVGLSPGSSVESVDTLLGSVSCSGKKD